MNRRVDVGVRVKLIKDGEKAREKIVPFKDGRAQLLRRRINQIDEDGHRICKNRKPHQPLERRNVEKQGIEQHADKVDEPEHIRNDKIFAERNIIIQWHMDYMKMGCHRFFHISEPWQIDAKI